MVTGLHLSSRSSTLLGSDCLIAAGELIAARICLRFPRWCAAATDQLHCSRGLLNSPKHPPVVDVAAWHKVPSRSLGKLPFPAASGRRHGAAATGVASLLTGQCCAALAAVVGLLSALLSGRGATTPAWLQLMSGSIADRPQGRSEVCASAMHGTSLPVMGAADAARECMLQVCIQKVIWRVEPEALVSEFVSSAAFCPAR